MNKEAMKLALGKIKSARDCHPNAVDTLLFEAKEILEGALAEQPAQQCRTDGRCQYAIDSGAEGMGHCPEGKCVMPAQQTCNCRWEGEVQVQQCTLHEAHVDAIHEWAERAKAAEARLREKNA